MADTTEHLLAAEGLKNQLSQNFKLLDAWVTELPKLKNETSVPVSQGVLFSIVAHLFIVRDQLAFYCVSQSVLFGALSEKKKIRHLPTIVQINALLKSVSPDWVVQDALLSECLTRLTDDTLGLASLKVWLDDWKLNGLRDCDGSGCENLETIYKALRKTFETEV